MSDLANSHLHRCQSCGTVWGHGNMMAGDVEAHKCPKCGAEGKDNWRIYRGGGAPVAQFPAHQAHGTFQWKNFILTVLLWAMVLMGSAYIGLILWRELAPKKAGK
jgi:hypothetical protein